MAAVNKLLQTMGSLAPGGTPTSDPQVFAFPLADVLEHSRALIDGSSPITRRRVAMMSAIEGVLGL